MLLSSCGQSAFDKRIQEVSMANSQNEKKNTESMNSFKITLAQLESKFEGSEIQKEEGSLMNFISLALFHFYNRDLSPEDYVQIINKYGSEKLSTDERVYQLRLYKALHKELAAQNIRGIDYKTLRFKYENEDQTEARFYRSIKTKDFTFHFYETTIKKDGEKWVFVKDQPVEDPEKVELLFTESLTNF